jgi:hypothetical protein
MDDLLVRLMPRIARGEMTREGSCEARFADLPPTQPPDLPPALTGLRVVKGGKG